MSHSYSLRTGGSITDLQSEYLLSSTISSKNDQRITFFAQRPIDEARHGRRANDSPPLAGAFFQTSRNDVSRCVLHEGIVLEALCDIGNFWIDFDGYDSGNCMRMTYWLVSFSPTVSSVSVRFQSSMVMWAKFNRKNDRTLISGIRFPDLRKMLHNL